MSGGARSGGMGLVGRRGFRMCGVGSRGVGRAARGWTGGAGSGGWCGHDGRARGRSVGRAGFSRSVGQLGPGDGSLVHHPR
jgi:hypothetical protein